MKNKSKFDIDSILDSLASNAIGNSKVESLRKLFDMISTYGFASDESQKISDVLIKLYPELHESERDISASIIFDRIIRVDRIDDLCALTLLELEESYVSFLGSSQRLSLALLFYKNMERLYNLKKSGADNLLCQGNADTPGPYAFNENVQIARDILKENNSSVL